MKKPNEMKPAEIRAEICTILDTVTDEEIARFARLFKLAIAYSLYMEAAEKANAPRQEPTKA